MPRKIFVAGEILTAADLQSNAVDQSVMVFNDAAARDTAIPSPIEGMVVYLKDTDGLLSYSGTAWVPAANSATLGAGTVLQVLSAARTTSFTTGSATFGDWTNVTISITPRATSSKVLVFLNATRVTNNGNNSINDMEIMRDSTSLYFPATFQNSNGSGHSSSLELVFLDSPNTTSATTYKGRIRTNSGTATFSAGSITVMEVAG